MSLGTLQDYERAVIYFFDLPSSDRDAHANANALCESVEADPRGWMLTLDLLRYTKRPEVKFFCLQSLQRLAMGAGVDGGNQANSGFSGPLCMQWVLESRGGGLSQEPKYVRNKIGVVLALLIKREFPNRWPSAFDELLFVLQSGDAGSADVFLATLSALDEEVVSIRTPESGRIKDAMRIDAVPKLVSAFGLIANAFAEIDSEIVKKCWRVFGLYVDWIDINLTTQESFLRIWFAQCRDPRFRTAAIWALGRLLRKGQDANMKIRIIASLGLADACVEWCAISARSNRNMSPSKIGAGVSSLLMGNGVIPPPVSSTVWALTKNDGLVNDDANNRSPGAAATYKLPANNRHLSTPQQFSNNTEDEIEEYLLETARFCESLGEELLDCRTAFLAKRDFEGLDAARPLMERALFCVFAIFSKIDKHLLQSTVIEFASRVVSCLKENKQERINDPELAARGDYFGSETTHRLLYAVLSSVRHPSDFDFAAALGFQDGGSGAMSMSSNLDITVSGSGTMAVPATSGGGVPAQDDEDDEEDEFRAHRSNVKRLYLNLVRCSMGDAVLPFLQNVAEACLSSFLEKDSPHDVEAVLYLIHAFGEAAPEVAQRLGASEDVERFDRLLLTVFSSSAFRITSHPVIANMYNELVARYVVALRAQSVDVLAHVVGHVTGTGGVHHPNPKVRSRASCLLLRIVRALENSCAPLCEAILIAIQDALDLSFEPCSSHAESSIRRTRSSSWSGTNGGGGGGGGSGGGGTSSPMMTSASLKLSSSYVASKQSILMQTGRNASPAMLAVPDVVALYETVGLMLGSIAWWPNPMRRRFFLQAVIAPLLMNLENAVQGVRVNVGQAGGTNSLTTVLLCWSSYQLEALASLAKGFSVKDGPEEIVNMWKESFRSTLTNTMELVRATSNPLPGAGTAALISAQENLANNARRLCHGMIGCVGIEVLQFFPQICAALLEPQFADVVRALPLVNQMMATFRSKMYDCLSASLLYILRITNARIAPVANCPNQTQHDCEELVGLEKELFMFLHSVASYDLANVFFAPANRAYLEELLVMLTDGMVSIPDANVQRVCATTIHLLAKEWLAPSSHLPAELAPAFQRFVFERITPASFQATSQPHFDVRDAACSTLLIIICTLHKTFAEFMGQQWLEYVGGVFLVSVNCPRNVIEEYIRAVVETKSPKELRTSFRKLFLEGSATTQNGGGGNSGGGGVRPLRGGSDSVLLG